MTDKRLRDSLAGLVGWAQMILVQKDMPQELRARFANNHRLTTAVMTLNAVDQFDQMEAGEDKT